MLDYYWFFIVQSFLPKFLCNIGLEKVRLNEGQDRFFFLKNFRQVYYSALRSI
jgi:hypothetical protein